MLIKLGIIVGIIILGVVIFSGEADSMLPAEATSLIDSLKNNVSDFGSQASDTIKEQSELPIGDIVNQTAGSVSEQFNDAGEKVTSEISKVKDSSQRMISEETFDFNPIESIQNLFAGK